MFSYAGQGAVMSSDISCYQTRGNWEYGDHDDCILLEVTVHSPKVCEVKGIVNVNIGPKDKNMYTFLL